MLHRNIARLEAWRLQQDPCPTWRDIEHFANLARGYLTHVAGGRLNPSWKTKLRIARALGVTVSAVFDAPQVPGVPATNTGNEVHAK